MGSFVRTAGGVAAAALIGAGAAAVPSTAGARAQLNVPCSTSALIATINAANTAGSGTLQLAANCNYDLTTAVTVGTRGPDGLPIITGDITLLGGPSTHIRRTVASPFRIAEVGTGARLNVQGVFIENGDAGANTGGGILSARGTVVLVQTTVRNNTADSGAGISNDSGTVVLDLVHLHNNNVRAGGGGGGAIYNDGRLSVIRSLIRSNRANTSGGGIYNEQGGSASFFRTTIDANTAGGNGGGLFNGVGGRAALTRTLVERNTAADGGGIFNSDGPSRLTLSASLIRPNTPNNCAPAGSVTGCVS